MWLPLLGLLAGVLLGLELKLNLPAELARYTAVGILAALAAPPATGRACESSTGLR